jgi:DNA-binding MarR family transcriptional regulator
MIETQQNQLQQGWEMFTRLFMKYDVLEKNPVDLGTGDRFTATQIHLIEAIGKGKAKTVTGLSRYFMVTKGAISQTVSQLVKAGYLVRVKRAGNDKEIVLELSEKGRMAFSMHENYNQVVVKELSQLTERYSPEELQVFINILTDVDKMLTGFVMEEKQP